MRMAALGQRYISAVRAAGGLPVLIPSDTPPEDAPALLATFDGLLLTGGGDIAPERYGGQPHPAIYGLRPSRDALELALVQEAIARRKPFFGICRGIQVLNVAMGGTLYEDLPTQYPNALRHRSDVKTEREMLAHGVRLAADSRLARLFGTERLEVNSLHHQGIRTVAPDLKATGWADDGLVEVLEVPHHPFGLAVQWHPEWLYQKYPQHLAVFRALVEAAQEA
jgi:putative glutamine amidotransferase